MLFDVEAALAEIRAEETARSLAGSSLRNVIILDAVRAEPRRQEVLHRAAKQEGGKVSGDSPADLVGIRAAGIRGGHVRRGG